MSFIHCTYFTTITYYCELLLTSFLLHSFLVNEICITDLIYFLIFLLFLPFFYEYHSVCCRLTLPYYKTKRGSKWQQHCFMLDASFLHFFFFVFHSFCLNATKLLQSISSHSLFDRVVDLMVVFCVRCGLVSYGHEKFENFVIYNTRASFSSNDACNFDFCWIGILPYCSHLTDTYPVFRLSYPWSAWWFCIITHDITNNISLLISSYLSLYMMMAGCLLYNEMICMSKCIQLFCTKRKA